MALCGYMYIRFITTMWSYVYPFSFVRYHIFSCHDANYTVGRLYGVRVRARADEEEQAEEQDSPSFSRLLLPASQPTKPLAPSPTIPTAL